MEAQRYAASLDSASKGTGSRLGNRVGQFRMPIPHARNWPTLLADGGSENTGRQQGSGASKDTGRCLGNGASENTGRQQGSGVSKGTGRCLGNGASENTGRQQGSGVSKDWKTVFEKHQDSGKCGLVFSSAPL
eukprot:977211-Pelagomonas_calceolata.AAC.3